MATNDLVVVLPGIMGSTLARNGKLVWAPSAGAALQAILTFGRSVKGLQLPEGIGDDHPGDGLTPVALMPDLHAIPGIWTPIKGYTVLVKFLRDQGYRPVVDEPGAPPGNLLTVPYDWRLSNRYNGRRLAGIVEPALERWRAQGGAYADARVVFVGHSMGGLVARWYMEKEGGAELTRKLITLGTPYRGAAKALVQLVDGVPGKIGRLAIDLTGFARSLPSLYQMLPDYACITAGDDLCAITDVTVPELSTRMITEAADFHASLREAEKARPACVESTHAILGTKQPTSTTVTLSAGEVKAWDTYLDDNFYGDSTVPLTGAVRAGVPLDSNLLRRVADKHGNLQRNDAALAEIEGVLAGKAVVIKARKTVQPQVAIPELLVAGEPLVVDVTLPANHAITVTVRPENERAASPVRPRLSHGRAIATFADLPPGAYSVDVTGADPATSPVAPVSSDLIVWDPDGQGPTP